MLRPAAEAIALIEKAMTLSPTYPANYLGQLGNAYRLAGRTDEALAAFRAYHARSPGFGLADIVMMQEQAGHIDEARATAAELIAMRPDFTVSVAGDAVPQRCRAAGGRRGVAAGGGHSGGVADRRGIPRARPGRTTGSAGALSAAVVSFEQACHRRKSDARRALARVSLPSSPTRWRLGTVRVGVRKAARTHS